MLLQKKSHITFFDCAYQGFATGDLDADAGPVRMFVKRGIEIFCCQSFAKNCGLYGERIGALNVVCASENSAKSVLSQLKVIARSTYSNPPMHGALIVYLILSKPELFMEWKVELKQMADRIQLMRQMLFDLLKSKDIHWPYMMKQIGMFSFTGLSPKQVELLQTKHHIFLTSDGRISLPALTSKTVPYVANAIHDVWQTEAKL